MLKIAPDGKTIRWVEAATNLRWIAGTPSLVEWQRLCHGSQTEKAIEKGVFRWVNGQRDDEVAVVFTPYGGLDFNLTYSISRGELLKIGEAR